jgi:hypothetical protein
MTNPSAKRITPDNERGSVPPPAERLCRIHRRPIQPSRWRSGHRTTGCARCKNTQPSHAAAQRKYKKKLLTIPTYRENKLWYQRSWRLRRRLAEDRF